MDEVDKRRDKPNHSDQSHDGDVPEGVAVELEARRLGEQHGSHQRALGRVEAGADNHSQSSRFIVDVVLVWATSADDLGAGEQHVSGNLRVHGRSTEVEKVERVVGHGDFGNGDRLASQHALVDNAVAGKQQAIAGELKKRWVRNLVHVSGDELAGVDVGPEAVAQDADVALELGDLAQPLHRGLCLDERRGDADDGDEEDGGGIVVVLVHGPEEQTGDLEDVERVEDLVDEQLAERLLGNVDLVLAKDELAVVALFIIETLAQSGDVGPGRVLPDSAAP
ncbi:hypothetical protein OPT61_g9603 [Boeremia exigua]|uniref:Uncharacterized protein n=1 Tax=Boeremia exigua TaxID=749465 RepID=A0ACC2HU14_9PLEO|nr:hypothetical protein OPT61_g9603 [Boeremia exigua]